VDSAGWPHKDLRQQSVRGDDPFFCSNGFSRFLRESAERYLWQKSHPVVGGPIPRPLPRIIAAAHPSSLAGKGNRVKSGDKRGNRRFPRLSPGRQSLPPEGDMSSLDELLFLMNRDCAGSAPGGARQTKLRGRGEFWGSNPQTANHSLPEGHVFLSKTGGVAPPCDRAGGVNRAQRRRARVNTSAGSDVETLELEG